MSYKRLGNYIQQVNVRNRDSETEVLLGVSITKKLIPSIANVIGTDMSVYKIIEKRQFAYGTVTSRNGEKISIALSDQYDKALVSQIYVVFEVINTEELLPEYLMMWFSRPEFDRYVRFHSHGSTRETFDWADMCEVELPIPSIKEQRQIVAQYQSIANKIKVNEQICSTLEATAQALYKHWFVDFEFPNEAGNPYKSSGGKMVWNEELGKEIPEGWEVKSLDKLYKFQYGLGNNNPDNGGEYPVYGSNGIIGYYDKFNSEESPVIGHIGANCGSMVFGYGKHYVTYNGVICKINKENDKYYGYRTLQFLDLMSETRGSSQPFISYDILHSLKYFEFNNTLLDIFNASDSILFTKHKILLEQIQKLVQLQSLLLSRLAVGEEEKVL